MVQIDGLNVKFRAGGKTVHAVRDFDLSVRKGEVVALIGESGSGKSATLRSVMRLHSPRNTSISGRIRIDGQDVLALKSGALTAFRGKTVAMVFQEPLLAFDPVYSIGDQIIETIRSHEAISASSAWQRALELFQRVRIPSPERRLMAYPHEMSGGMRQRAMIALALACRPQVLLADEPTTALDATVQIQILLLLREVQRELGLSIIFVTHDMGAAAEVADRVAVMYAGEIVEDGPATDVLVTPRHPYTQALLRNQLAGQMDRSRRLDVLAGSPPDLSELSLGCAFAARCPRVLNQCRLEAPPFLPLDARHGARCIRLHDDAHSLVS